MLTVGKKEDIQSDLPTRFPGLAGWSHQRIDLGGQQPLDSIH